MLNFHNFTHYVKIVGKNKISHTEEIHSMRNFPYSSSRTLFSLLYGTEMALRVQCRLADKPFLYKLTLTKASNIGKSQVVSMAEY